MEKTLTCQVCGKEVRNLASHVNYSDDHPSWDEYKEEHPSARPFPDDVMEETLGKGKGEYWSEEEEEILRERYPEVGPHIPELRERGKSKMAIIKKAGRMGLEPFRHSCERWTEEEEKILREKYPTQGSDIPELLNNGRTKSAIQNYAYRLGIDYEKRDTNGREPWTEEEVEILRKEYPKRGWNIPELLDRGRSKHSIKEKAEFEGIEYEGKGSVWTEEEIKILREEYPENGPDIPELLENGRTKESIRAKALSLGLYLQGEHHDWTEEEEELIREKYPEQGTNIQELLGKGLSRSQIRSKASKLGVRVRESLKEWSKEEIRILREKYPKNGPNIPQLLEQEGITWYNIKWKAHKLGIKYGQEKKKESKWKGSYEICYGPDWCRQKRKARERDNHACQNCGKTRKELGRKLSVHHIIPFREFSSYKRANQIDNLVCLCPSCHTKAEYGRIKWLNRKEKKLREKITDKTEYGQRTLKEYC